VTSAHKPIANWPTSNLRFGSLINVALSRIAGGSPTEWTGRKELFAMFRGSRKPTVRSALDALSSVAVIAAAGVLVYKVALGPTGRPALEVPSEPLSIEQASITGSADAEIVMVVYSDFQCPFCGRFTREVLPEIQRRYVDTGQVALAFRHMPLPIHPEALQAAVSAECAGDQGQFWPMHDLLFAQQGQLDQESLGVLSHTLELDQSRFDRCLQDQAVRERIQASVDEARQMGIAGTPAFFFGRRLSDGRVKVVEAVAGALPIEEFIRELDTAMTDEEIGWRKWLPFI